MTEQAPDKPRLTARTLGIYAGVGAGAAALVWIVSTFIGQYHISGFFLTDGVWQSRALRVLAAAVAGAALGTAGMALQGLLRNPLAEPYVLGISSGAGVGVLVGPLVAAAAGLGQWATTPVLALGGALATCLAVYSIAQRHGRLDPYVLLLSGVIISVFNSALMMGILLFCGQNQRLGFISWGMGRIPDSPDGLMLVLCGACVVAGWLVLLLRGAAFNTLGLGDDVASSSGVRVHWLRTETFVVVGLVTAAAVGIAGPIGFLGLIVPHICRMIFGADHRRLAVVSGFAGAVLLMIADTLGRTCGGWFNVGDIPVGVITAMAGGPFFIYLLRRRFKEMGR
ncbi:MAG: FecCD family ABC transporter permease [Phycisphaerae bacterium]